jgi:peptidoglycan/xylan/chitin deacetylase (PgdA/CDA1 family)
MPTYYQRNSFNGRRKQKHRQRLAAVVFIVIALVIGVVISINRSSTKSETINTNVVTNAVVKTNSNKNTNKQTNQNKDTNVNENTNAAVNANLEITNTATNININFEGVPAEITKGDTSKKQVIFTFDAGSGSQSAQQILDTLKKYNLHATFFMTGKWAEKNKETTKKISEAGNEIFNHTYSHPHLTQVTDEDFINELQRTETIIKDITGKISKPFFRPPYGERNAHILGVAAGQGYRSVMWTVDALDWEESTGMTADKVKEKVMSKLGSGVIYLMHVGDTITGKVLDDLIQQIQAKEYTIVPLSKGV